MIRDLLARAGAHLDHFLMGMLMFILLIGLFVLYSASGQSFDKVASQFFNILAAFALLWVAANIPPQQLERIAVPVYTLGMILLIGVTLFGKVSHGAQRWLDLGVGRIQPSELMKIAVPMQLAWYFARREASLRLLDYAIGALLLAVPVALIIKQPDLGTALLIGFSGFFVLFFAGLSVRLLLGIVLTGGVLAPILWSFLRDYQRKRIEILFDPYQDALGAGYHTIQASIALGSGGIAGKGWLYGTQSQLDFLPERSTDFIFAVFGEEFGLLGILLLLVLFGLIIARGLVIAAEAQNTFCRLLAGSITLTFFSYVFVNIGMVSGILPVVGIPLPLISYGGTSLVTMMLGFGILMSIQTHRKLITS